ncbi:olfactory receptor 1M1-like [Nothobranchius furzeri]|uniref:Olfactory receptor 24-like n=1 Tax=Nothobranchius furzeri TaxID=105023 RepID=A0A8C6PYL4_NOTFU|nr:olfactory receptor 24-like [Nothobranchius furzeri]KAF7216140.1 olfactory receptor 24-like [Nothobranchius furzeri]
MENRTPPFYFNLTMFVNIRHYRLVAFTFCVLLYSFIVSANLLLILVITQHRALHQPMYMFIALLSLNSLYGSTGFFPRFLMDLLADVHLISYPACFTQIYIIYTYAVNELTILSVMAYDRHVAVCHPLHYYRKITPKAVVVLSTLAWIFPALVVSAVISLSAQLPLCGNEIQKVFCANWNVVKLSCVSTNVNNILGIFIIITTVSLPIFFLYTYLRIFLVCWRKSAEFKGKVLQTCLPHLVSFVVYLITSICDFALSRSRLGDLNSFAAVILSLEFVVIPPVLNPLIYGLNLPDIRRRIFGLLQGNKR